MNEQIRNPDMDNKSATFLERLSRWAVPRRITLNRAVLFVVLVVLTHPRNRIFFAAGLALALAGAVLRIWARVTPPDRPGGLVMKGPYQLVRHPMYLGTALQAAGMWVACFGFRNFVSFAMLGLILGGYMLFVYKQAILLEEEEMMSQWAGEWEHYASRTPVFLPGKEAVKQLRWSSVGPLDFRRLEKFKEWKNFLACLGIFAFLWFKLVYRL
ncbi:MAG: isoprenylcysteine carboxylmethyltransferase family protein [Elusimicrobia bacterium]|nr:isoprenylcysteine carboxylmethyltransferase family protein [Elusimicrobiota bacterium]